MYFQKFIKGINGLSELDAKHILENGIDCNWWKKKKTISPLEIMERLTEKNLLHHLNDYEKALPTSHPDFTLGKTYGDVTAFISTTAGAYQLAHNDQYDFDYNRFFPPLLTALRFATKNFRTSGALFFGYVITLGKKAVEMEQFSEEVREMHIYTDYLKYHHEGEITAKIIIPSVQIERVEIYDPSGIEEKLKKRERVIPVRVIKNNNYIDPIRFSNIREVL